jgi:hypothetical protein
MQELIKIKHVNFKINIKVNINIFLRYNFKKLIQYCFQNFNKALMKINNKHHNEVNL